METVTKSSSMGGAFASLPKFSSDASKVISRGAGLSKAFVGQKNTFTVDCSKAGEKLHNNAQTYNRKMRKALAEVIQFALVQLDILMRLNH